MPLVIGHCVNHHRQNPLQMHAAITGQKGQEEEQRRSYFTSVLFSTRQYISKGIALTESCLIDVG